MRLAFLAIGDELLRGESREGNGYFLAQKLSEGQLHLSQMRVVADDFAEIAAALAELSAVPTLLICSGGLGPTDDDFTRAAVAAALGVPVVRDQAVLAAIEARFASMGRAMHPANARQADFPQGAEVIANPFGTAPGFVAQLGALTAVCLPGVPREFSGMVDANLEAWLAKVSLAQLQTSQAVTLRLFGIPESDMQGVLSSLPLYGAVKMRSLPTWPEIRLKLAPAGAQPQEITDFHLLLTQLREALGWRIYGEGDADSHPAAVLRALLARDLQVAVAESCTGGLVAQLLTSVPGASRSLVAGVVAYANSAKTALLGVDAALIEQHGAVSQEVAEAMALGALRVSGADVAVATTGIAGPDGGSAEKPVGTLWLALAWQGGVHSAQLQLSGIGRGRFQTLAAHHALSWVRRWALKLL